VRFLFSRRWVLFAVLVVLMAYGCYLLGQWQFHRLHDREGRNSQTTRNLAAAPVPVEELMAVGRPVSVEHEWRRVTATGEYVDDQSIVVRYQTREGSSGVDVVTPLRTEQGPTLLVDRGWLASPNSGNADVDLPPAPPGAVTVTGWVRVDATGSAAEVHDGSTRAISSAEIAPTLPRSAVYGGFVDAEKERPAPDSPLVKAELPDLGNGPHFFYGLQWWFFGLLAVFGFGYLAYDERRKARHSERSMPPSTGSITPLTNDAAGESRKAAARPNSSGRP
jgi:cytochrome oxidase assembly protein ShyY1